MRDSRHSSEGGILEVPADTNSLCIGITQSYFCAPSASTTKEDLVTRRYKLEFGSYLVLFQLGVLAVIAQPRWSASSVASSHNPKAVGSRTSYAPWMQLRGALNRSDLGLSLLHAKVDSTLSPLGDWLWGPCFTAALYRDSFAVIGNGELVQILDVARLDSPQVAGEYATHRPVKDLTVQDSLVFVVAGSDLVIIDVGDARQPHLVSDLSLGSVIGERIVLEGTKAYITTLSLLFVVDIANPDQPNILGTAALGETFACHAIRNGIVYVGFDRGALTRYPTMFDCRDALNIRSLGSFDTTGVASGVFVSDTLLYLAGVADSSLAGFLKVFDISDPTHPELLSTSTISDTVPLTPYFVSVRDTMGYVCVYSQRFIDLIAYSVRSPRGISFVQRVRQPNPPYGYISVVPGVASVIAPQGSGLRLFSKGLCDTLLEAGFFMTGFYSADIKVCGDRAFITHDPSGLTILDVSDPVNLKRISAIQLPNRPIYDSYTTAYQISVSDTLALITTNESIEVVNIADLNRPRPESFIPMRGAFGIARKRNCAYITQFYDGLTILDIENPRNLSILARLSLPGNVITGFMALADTVLGLVNYGDGMTFVDIHDSTSPRILSSLPGFVGGMAANGNYFYVTANDSFLVYMLPIGPAPMPIGSISFVGLSNADVSYASKFVYAGTYAIDVSTPIAPAISGHVVPQVGATFFGNDASGRYFYYCDDFGVHVIQNSLALSVPPNSSERLDRFTLQQNYPNPFNPSTSITYELAHAAEVNLAVYDLLGREIAILVNGREAPGRHSVQWNAGKLPSGVYYYRLQTGRFMDVKKMIHAK